jgi:hypothetical protein
MVLVGSVTTLLFGALTWGGWTVLPRAPSLGTALGAALGTVLLAAIAAYGAWLAWRGLRGYSRRSAWSDRAMLAVAAGFGVLGATGLAFAVVDVLRTDPLMALRASWISEVGGGWRMGMFVFAFPLQLAAHELGHVLCGRLVGFGFVSIQVGPWCLDRELGRWRVTFRPLAFGFGGRAMMRFRHEDRLGPRQAVFAAGGPAANLLHALLAGLAAAALSPPHSSPSAFAVGLLGGCEAQGLVLGVLNLVPIGLAGTDGARILQALRRPRALVAVRAGPSLEVKPPPFLRVVDKE